MDFVEAKKGATFCSMFSTTKCLCKKLQNRNEAGRPKEFFLGLKKCFSYVVVITYSLLPTKVNTAYGVTKANLTNRRHDSEANSIV